MTKKLIMSAEEIRRTLARMAHEIVERNHGCQDLVFIGIYTRGVPLAHRIAAKIREFEGEEIPVGTLDFAGHRDDLSCLDKQPEELRPSVIPFDIAGKRVVLVDDVLYTGRSVRAAMDALIEFGRPRHIQLAVFVDRGHREMPIRADYVGRNLPTSRGEEVEVQLREVDGEDRVMIVKRERERQLTGRGKVSP